MPDYCQRTDSLRPVASAFPADSIPAPSNGEPRKSAKNPGAGDGLHQTASIIKNYCVPLIEHLNRGMTKGQIPLPALDAAFLALEALKDADLPGAGWRVVAGRITMIEGSGSLYQKGFWLQADDGRILDLNRPDLDAGVRVTRAEDSLIAEYRFEKALTDRKTSPLYRIWKGEIEGYTDFASRAAMRSAYEGMKQKVAQALAASLSAGNAGRH